MLYVNSCCCTCLAQEGLQSVHNKDSENVTLLEKVISCLLEKDSIFDSAPLLICDKCTKHVDESYKFKKMGLRNLDLFRNCLKQLIKNPFSNLCINVVPEAEKPPEQGPSLEIMPEPQERQEVIVKIEAVAENVEEEPKRIDATNMNLQITNVESVNQSQNLSQSFSQTLSQSSQNYRNPLAKASPTKKCFPKSTICHPCGKKFVRDDYYLRHILSCTLNDTSTKNSVLRWAENRTINIRGQTIPLLDTMMDYKTKRTVPLAKPVKNLGRKSKMILDRSSCKFCKKKIATKFMKRHTKKCNFNDINTANKIRDDVSCHTSTSSDSNEPISNLTM